ncbi:hypothetical protein D9M70_473490 [compost metagenome]
MNAKRAGGTAHEETRPALGEEGVAAPRLDRRGAHVAEMLFEGPCDAIRFDHQHGNAIGLRPGAPVGRDVGQVVCDEQRNAEVRVVVMKFQRHCNVSVAVIDRASRDPFECPRRQCDRKRQAARW